MNDPSLNKMNCSNVNFPYRHFFWIITLFFIISVAVIIIHFRNEIRQMDASRIIIVDKGKLILSLIKYNGEVIDEFPVAVGKEYGNKDTVGDNKTPEGIFRIVSIERSEKWELDDETDSLPAIKGLYGPWFLRLDTGFEGIGIHGSPENAALEKRSTQGCIRLDNKDLEKLRNEVDIGTRIIIIPSKDDL